jgi:hypothetical protein
MSERRGPHRPSEKDRSAQAAREEARRELAAAEGEVGEELRELAAEVAAAEAGGGAPVEPPAEAAGGAVPPDGPFDPTSVIVQNSQLTPRQRQVLADLVRLQRSLRGPQVLFDATGNFSRPVFPVSPRRR